MSCKTVRSFVSSAIPARNMPHPPTFGGPKDKAQARGVGLGQDGNSTVVIAQTMLDRWEVDQDDFALPQTPTGTLLNSSFAFNTDNAPPAAFNVGPTTNTAIKLNWNGVTRILITPTMAYTAPIAETTVNGFAATVSGLTLYGTRGTSTTADQVTNTTQFYPFDAVQAMTYTISVLTGQELLDELTATYGVDATTKRAFADALVGEKQGGGLEYKTGSAMVLSQGTANYADQYEGTYAAEDADCKTEALAEASYVDATTTKAPVIAKITGAGTASANVTFAYNAATTTMAVVAPDAAVDVPILGMIRIDLPEDVVSNIYTSRDGTETGKVTTTVVNLAGQISVAIGYGTSA